MVKTLVQRIVLLSVASAALYACLPDKASGRFAKEIIELIKLLAIITTVLEMIR